MPIATLVDFLRRDPVAQQEVCVPNAILQVMEYQSELVPVKDFVLSQLEIMLL